MEKQQINQKPGNLFVIASPIGNLEDISFRAIRILKEEVQTVFCEDSRRTRILLQHYQISLPISLLRNPHEERETENALRKLQAGDSIALLSDGGTPLVSDPGFLLVSRAIKNNIPIQVIPGASAVLTAFVLSGLSSGPFRFAGFVPRKGKERKEFLDSLIHGHETVICFESPKRIEKFLLDLEGLNPDVEIALTRELTKKFESVLRGSVSEVKKILTKDQVRGEFTVVVSPVKKKSNSETDSPWEVHREKWEFLVQEIGLKNKEASMVLERFFQVPRKAVYEWVDERDKGAKGQRGKGAEGQRGRGVEG